MRRIVPGSVALVFVVGLGLGLAACGDDTPEAASSSSSTSSTVVEPSSSSSESTPPSPSPSSSATIPASNAEEYATDLINAWVRGDRTLAEQLAVTEAFDTLFSYEPAEDGVEPNWALETCEGAAGSSYCTFGAGGDPTIVVRVTNEAASAGAPEAVTEVKVES